MEPLFAFNADVMIAHQTAPKQYTTAMKYEYFRQAIAKERNQFIEQDVYRVPTTEEKAAITKQKIVPNFWAFRYKFNNLTQRHEAKARLITLGNRGNGTPGPTSSPSLNPITFRIIIKEAVQHKWIIRGLDISSAFLNADLPRLVYTHRPDGFEQQFQNDTILVCHKASYGLRDSPRAFWRHVCHSLEAFQYHEEVKLQPNYMDTCCYPCQYNCQTVGIIGFYMDDFSITGIPEFVEAVMTYLESIYKLDYTDNPKSFLGHEMKYLPDAVFLHQESYVTAKIKELGLEEFVKVNTHKQPAPCSIPKSWVDQELKDKKADAHTIQQYIGVLIWLSTRTKPDISFLVSHYASQPHTQLTLAGLKYLIGYGSATKNHGVLIRRDDTILTLKFYTDASLQQTIHAGCTTFYGSTLIQWRSVKSPEVLHGSTKIAEMAVLYIFSQRFLCIAG